MLNAISVGTACLTNHVTGQDEFKDLIRSAAEGFVFDPTIWGEDDLDGCIEESFDEYLNDRLVRELEAWYESYAYGQLDDLTREFLTNQDIDFEAVAFELLEHEKELVKELLANVCQPA